MLVVNSPLAACGIEEWQSSNHWMPVSLPVKGWMSAAGKWLVGPLSEMEGPKTQALCSVNSCGRLAPEQLPEACGSPAGWLSFIRGVWIPCSLKLMGHSVGSSAPWQSGGGCQASVLIVILTLYVRVGLCLGKAYSPLLGGAPRGLCLSGNLSSGGFLVQSVVPVVSKENRLQSVSGV